MTSIRTAPAALTSQVSPTDDESCFPKDNWALQKCGFKEGRENLDQRPSADARPIIAVIDVGSAGFNDRCLRTATVKSEPAANPSAAIHAAEVTGVIVSAVPAEIHVYGVATTGGLDMQLILKALQQARESGARVFNLSIGWHQSQKALNDEVTACIDAGIVVVAAMGEHEDPYDIVSYPAAIPGVVAVGATDRYDRRIPSSGVGNNIWIAAPGEEIPTVGAATGQGTSFATALVSAAAWLAVRAQPKWSADEIRTALAKSANAPNDECPPQLAAQINPPNGKWNPALGCGRLNVANLASVV